MYLVVGPSSLLMKIQFLVQPLLKSKRRVRTKIKRGRMRPVDVCSGVDDVVVDEVLVGGAGHAVMAVAGSAVVAVVTKVDGV